ncbi:MAG: hypothetical protein R3B93_10525 [Bacteroidia bacterium]
MKQKKGREFQLNYLIKSAIARKYYQRLDREYDTEAARKQFNQDKIDTGLLIEVIEEAMAEEIKQIKEMDYDE